MNSSKTAGHIYFYLFFSFIFSIAFVISITAETAKADCYSGYEDSGTQFPGYFIYCTENASEILKGDYAWSHGTNCTCSYIYWIYSGSCSGNTYHYAHDFSPLSDYEYYIDTFYIGHSVDLLLCPACHGYYGCDKCSPENCDSCFEGAGGVYQCVYDKDFDACNYTDTAINDNYIRYEYGQACTMDRCDYRNGEGYYPNVKDGCRQDMTTPVEQGLYGLCTSNGEADGNIACSNEDVCELTIHNPDEGQPSTTYMTGCSPECIDNRSPCDRDVKKPLLVGNPYFNKDGHCAPDGACNNAPNIPYYFLFNSYGTGNDSYFLCETSISDEDYNLYDPLLYAKFEIMNSNNNTLFSDFIICNRRYCSVNVSIDIATYPMNSYYECKITPYDGHEYGVTESRITFLSSSKPTIFNVTVTPNYTELYRNNQTTSYADIFENNPIYQIRFTPEDADNNDVNVSVHYNISGLTWPDDTLDYDFRGYKTCKKDSLCAIDIPYDHIRPGDHVRVIFYIKDQWGSKSDILAKTIKVPDFDLTVVDLEAIQTIVDVPLIMGKDTMLRVYPRINSTIVNFLRNVNASSSHIPYGVMNHLLTNQSEYGIGQLGVGANSVNMFSFKPDVTGYMEIFAEINFDKKFKESDSDNNFFNDTFLVKEVKKNYRILYVPIIKVPESQVYNETLFRTQSSATITSACNRQTRWLSAVFPIPEANLSYTCDNRVIPFRNPHVGHGNIVYYINAASDKFIIENLGKMVKSKLNIDYNQYDWIIGVLLNKGEQLRKAQGVHHKRIKKFVLINERADEWVTSHEIGHDLKWKDEYGLWWDDSKYPFGSLAADGWFVPGGRLGNRLSIEKNNFKTFDNCYDLMGAGPRCWINSKHYNDLLDKMVLGGHDPVLLSVFGNVFRNGTVSLMPIFNFEGFFEENSEGNYSIEVLNGETILASNRFSVPIMNETNGLNESFFAVNVPYFPETDKIIIYEDGIPRLEINKSPDVPVVEIFDTAVSESVVWINWSYTDNDNGQTGYRVGLVCDGRDVLHIHEGREIVNEFNAENFPGGKECRFDIEVSDNFHISKASTGSFPIQDKTPDLSISLPDPLSVFNTNDELLLLANAYDPEDGDIKDIKWYFNGVFIGNGSFIHILGYNEGYHTISAKVTDSKANSVKENVTILIDNGRLPELTINSFDFGPQETHTNTDSEAVQIYLTVSAFLTKEERNCKVIMKKDNEIFFDKMHYFKANEITYLSAYFNLSKTDIINISLDISCKDGEVIHEYMYKPYFSNLPSVPSGDGWNLFSPIFGEIEHNFDKTINLLNGWNLIGFSSNKPVYWLNSSIIKDGKRYSINNASLHNLIQRTIFYYDTKNGVYGSVPGNDEFLEPKKGYWVYANDIDLTLVFHNVSGPKAQQSFYWENVSIVKDNNVVNFQEGNDLGWLKPSLYYFDENVGYYKTIPTNYEYVHPWIGYWLKSTEGVTIRLG